MIPEQFKTEYWTEVKQRLVTKHGYQPQRANRAIESFQAEALQKIGEMVFHAEPEDAAIAVANWFDSQPASQAVRTA